MRGDGAMGETFRNPRHEAVRQLLKERRQRAELSQREVAERLGRTASWMSDVEKGQHRVTVVEFLDFAEALGFDAPSALRRVARVRKS